jgi:predicted transcriptional regulator
MTEKDLHLAEGEYRFAALVWENEPLSSGQLAAISAAALGWKKSTAYTVLKKLCGRGILQNENGTVTALVKREAVRRAESSAVVEKTFSGSLPQFVAAFLEGKPISAQEAAEIRALLDRAERGPKP